MPIKVHARPLNASVWVRRVRRADFLTIDNSCLPSQLRPGSSPKVSTYNAVQICGTTSNLPNPIVAAKEVTQETCLT